MRQVLYKALVGRFYAINTGFFLVVFILLFGLLNGQATIDMHYFIMRRISGSPAFFAGAVVVWLLYAVKCLSFMLRFVGNPSNEFIFTLQCVDDRKQLILLTECFTAMLAPMLVYGGVAIAVGLADGHVLLPALFAIVQIALCGGSVIGFRSINGTWKQPVLHVPHLLPSMPKPFMSYLLHFSLSERKGTFAGIKILSLLLLQGMVWANKYAVDRESICVLMMFLVSAHALLPLYYTGFMERKVSFVRNMPVARNHVLLTYLLTYAIIFLPELLFLLLNSRHAIPTGEVISLYAVALSQMMLYTSLQYMPGITTERYTGVVFVFFFASLLFLASFNLWPLAIVEAIGTAAIFYPFYYRYEAKNL